MGLSTELASQLAKVINEDKKPTKSDTTVYGTVVEYDGRTYVKLDGSDRLTPVTATTSVKQDERVTVMIKDHSAIVTGNLSDPAASDSTVTEIGNQISEFEIIVSDKVSTKELAAETARIDTLVSDNVYIRETLTANEAKFTELEAETAKIEALEADNVTINNTLTANKATIEQLEADIANIDAVSAKDLEAVNAKIHNLEGTYADFESTTTNKFSAVDAEIDRLDVDKLSATTADAMYANIDFSNIGKAAMEYFYATSGLIKDVKVGDATITGELIGVTIKGDLIEGNTIKAEKLVIKGSDGLYYKLNTDGVTTEAEQTEYNSLDGSHILANSITASKISVEDLVAFDATIGGFNISDSAIYSGVKETIGNTTRGLYLGKDGQFNFGDSNNYLKYFKDTDGKYKLEIMASSVLFASGKNIEDVLDEVEATGISKVEVMYYQSTSSSSLVGGTWSASAPTWVSGKYIWSKTVTTLKNGNKTESTAVCITGEKGATGAAGKDGTDGAAGKDGANGVGVKSIVEKYYRSTSNTSQTGGSWSTKVPAWVNGTYIWTRSTITYTDNTTKTTSPVCVTGAKGATGAAGKDGTAGKDGIGIKSVDVWYFLSTSSSSLKGGSWVTTAPAWADGKYMWSKTVTTYTDNTTTESTPVCITGSKGQNGADGAAGKDGAAGIGVKSIVEEYYRSTSNASQTGGSWSTKVPAWVNGTYIWTRSTITYTDGTTKTTSPVCVTGAKGATGAAGKDGADGAAGKDGKDGVGIKSVDVWYFLSTSSSSLKNGTWVTTAPEWVDGKYMWSQTVTTYTDNTTTESTPVCITGAHGQNGAAGANGSDGVGVKSIIAEFYLSTSKDTQAGGSWVTTSPTWVSGTYLWTRSVITYTDGTTKTTNPLCDSSWEAVNDINLGGTNLFRDTKTMTTQNGYVSLYGNPTVIEDGSGYGIATLPGDGTNDAMCFFFQDTIDNMVGKEVALSFDALSDALATGSKLWAIYVGLFDSNGVRGKYAAISFLEATKFNTDKYVNGEWVRCKISFVLPGIDGMKGTANEHVKYGVQIFSLTSNTKYPMQIKKVKCEYGNKATEWSPAPEDIDVDINNVSSDFHTALTNQNAEITDNYTKAIMDALTDYNKTGDFNEFKNSVEKNLSNMANDISDNFNLTMDQIGNLNKDVQDKFSHFENYVHIDNDAGTVTIGKGDGSVTLRFEADLISFMRNGKQFGRWDGVNFHTGNIVIDVEERAQFGNFAFVPRTDGSLSFLKVGG